MDDRYLIFGEDKTQNVISLMCLLKLNPYLFLLACNFILIGCEGSHNIKHYNYLGQASFRRTYAGHENWSDSELDSVLRSNPTYMLPSNDSAENVLDTLIKLGIANKSELFLDKIAPYLKDTIIIKNSYADTVYIEYDTSKMRAAILIKNEQTVDSIPIIDEFISHTFSLVTLKNNSSSFIIFVNKYYIMNGDNYEVSLYEKK